MLKAKSRIIYIYYNRGTPPSDQEEEVKPQSATSGTYFTWGVSFWNSIDFKPRNILSGVCKDLLIYI